MPFKFSPAAAYSGHGSGGGKNDMDRADDGDKGTLHVFDMRAPRWRPRLHPGSRSLGEPDVYVRRAEDPPAPEDELSESNVKNGLNTRPAVGNETFSAHDMIYDRLRGKSTIQQLGALFDEVVQRRDQLADLRCGPAASQYRHPQRVTLNEVKLAAYVRDLADSSVPLRKLARSVPHGYRGERMLDMLWNGGSLAPVVAAVKTQQQSSVGSSNANHSPSSANGPTSGVPSSVAIDRAVWFVRVVGASEISSSRLRQGKAGAYTAEWTGVYMGWLRRQIVELNIVHHHPHNLSSTTKSPAPLSPNVSRNAAVKQSPSHPAATTTPQRPEEPYALVLEEDFRLRWMSKWKYSLSLLRALIYESLIDVQIASRMALEMLRSANIAQVFVALGLVEEFLPAISNSATLMHFHCEVLSTKLSDLRQSDQAGRMQASLVKELETSLLFSFAKCSNDDAFVLPSCWQRIFPTLRNRYDEAHNSTQKVLLQSANERNTLLLDGFAHILERKVSYVSDRYTELKDVRILDGIAEQDSLTSTFEALFSDSTEDYAVNAGGRIRRILFWSTTKWRYGTFRPFAGATLIDMYVRRQPSRTQRAFPSSSQRRSSSGLQRLDIDSLVTAWVTDVDNAQRADRSVQDQHGANGKPSLDYNALQSISVTALVILLGELCRRGCFSYQKYLQRLTARGLTANGTRDGDRQEDAKSLSDSLHAKLLRSLPLLALSPALEYQRKLAIYGSRTKESWEEATERRARREVQRALSWMTAMAEPETPVDVDSTDLTDSELDLPHFWSSSRYIKIRIIHSDVLPAFWSFNEQQANLSASQFAQLTSILVKAEDYEALWRVIEFLGEIYLPQSIDEKQQSAVSPLQEALRTFVFEHTFVWLAMGLNPPAFLQSSRSLWPSIEPQAEPAATVEGAVDISKAEEEATTSLRAWTTDGSMNVSFSQSLPNRTMTASIAVKTAFNQSQDSAATSAEDICNWLNNLVKLGVLDVAEFSSLFVIALREKESSASPLPSVLCNLTLSSLARQTIRIEDFMGKLVLPALREVIPGLDHLRIGTLLGLLTPIFMAKRQTELAHTRAMYLGRTNSKAILDQVMEFCCLLSAAEQSVAEISPQQCEQIASIRDMICTHEKVRACVQGRLQDSIIFLHEFSPYGSFHRLVSELLPGRWPWTSDAELLSAKESVFEHTNVFQWDQTLCELRVIVKLILQKQRPHISNGNGSNTEVQSLARLIEDRILSNEEAKLASTTLELLLSNEDSGEFANAILEQSIKRLNVQLEATFAEDAQIRLSLLGVFRLLRYISRSTALTVSASAVHCLRIVCEWFENKSQSLARSIEEEAGGSEMQELDRLKEDEEAASLIRLATVCMLLRQSGLLSIPSAKMLAPRLFCTLLHIALGYAHRPDILESRLTSVLDVATYILQQAPFEVQQAMQARALEQVGSTLFTGPCPLVNVAKRIAYLINLDSEIVDASSTGSWQSCALIEAQSNSSAFVDGLFNPVNSKPWESHPNLDVVPGGTLTTGAENGATQTIANAKEMESLTNNGPVSLHHFGAHRTLDVIPDLARMGSSKAGDSHHTMTTAAATTISGGLTEAEVDQYPPRGLISEESYGLHLAGQTIYSRDVLRGLLAMPPMVKGKVSARNLVPALQPNNGSAAASSSRQTHASTLPNASSLSSSSVAESVATTKKTSHDQVIKGTLKNEIGSTAADGASNAGAGARKRKPSTSIVVDGKASQAVGGRKKPKKT